MEDWNVCDHCHCLLSGTEVINDLSNFSQFIQHFRFQCTFCIPNEEMKKAMFCSRVCRVLHYNNHVVTDCRLDRMHFAFETRPMIYTPLGKCLVMGKYRHMDSATHSEFSRRQHCGCTKLRSLAPPCVEISDEFSIRLSCILSDERTYFNILDSGPYKRLIDGSDVCRTDVNVQRNNSRAIKFQDELVKIQEQRLLQKDLYLFP